MKLNIHTVFKLRENILFLEEWIAYHSSIGVHKFYLYDNSNSIGADGSTKEINRYGIDFQQITQHLSNEDVDKLLENILIKYADKIIHKQWNPKDDQGNIYYDYNGAIKDYISNYSNNKEWTAFIDLDEYIFSEQCLTEFISSCDNKGVGDIILLQKKFDDRFNNIDKPVCTIVACINGIDTQCWGPKHIIKNSYFDSNFTNHWNMHSIPVKNCNTLYADVKTLRFNHYNVNDKQIEWMKSFYHTDDNFFLNGECYQLYNQYYKNSSLTNKINNSKIKVPVVSIVLPVYNSEKYIADSIESILNQTFSDFELIIIDDDSTDDTHRIIELFGDNRIKLIKNNHDYIQSLNKGIAKSKGKYIARMDSDDLMLPNRLELQVEYMENNPQIDICGGWIESFGHSSHTIKNPIKHKDIILAMLIGNSMAHPTIIMRRDSMSKLPFYPNLYKQKFIYAEDYKLWIDSIMNGLQFANIPEILLKYRISENQNTSKFSETILRASTHIQIEYLEYVMEKIVEHDESLYYFINSSIELLNQGKIKIHNLKEIIYSIYSDQII